VSPILVRPIREQFEHNRVIRLLVARFRRKFSVGVNIGDEPEASGVRSGTDVVYPDLVLTNAEGARRIHGVVEVETTESVNYLEAMAEWVSFGKVRGAFYLFVPAGSTDVARRLCDGSHVAVTEIWGYHAVGEQLRFTMTYRSARAAAASRGRAAKEAASAKAKPAVKAKAKPAAKAKAKPAAKAKAKPAAKAKAKPAAKAKAKPAAKAKAAVKSTTKKASVARPSKRR
jgi:flagellar biosynthesis GTPase FlhF